ANVTVTGEVTGNDNHIEVPAAEAGKTGETSITVTFEDVDAGAAISFGGATSSDNSEYDGTVYINAPADVEFEDLTINLPYAHVVFNGEAQTTNASTGPGTFVVAEGASIGTLNVNAGNVDVYGTVGTITRDDEKNISSITTVKIYIPDGDIQKAYEMVGNYESLVLNEKFEIIAIDSNSSNIELALSFELADFTSTTVLPANCDKVNHWIITDAGSPTEAEFTNFRTILYNHNDLKNKGLILTFSQMEAIADDNIIAPTGKENTSVSTINAPKATKIGFAAFQSFKTLENINFPEVTTLGGFGEFMYCTSLEYVYLPKVEALSQWTFSDCTALLEVNLPELITVAYRSFYNCSVLSTVYLPEVETISQGGFMWCGTLKSIDLPSVTTVGTQAFNVCQKLETITLPSVTSIGSKAFGNSISLISMELATNPDTELTSFGVDGDVFDYSDAYSALSHVAASTVVTVGEGACTVTDNSLTVGDSTYEFKEIIVK
ncbi:MAG: leucine-rich repeat domain-containing protein, partial [Rikenellaceae bacterium]